MSMFNTPTRYISVFYSAKSGLILKKKIVLKLQNVIINVFSRKTAVFACKSCCMEWLAWFLQSSHDSSEVLHLLLSRCDVFQVIVMYLQVLEAEKNQRLVQCAW